MPNGTYCNTSSVLCTANRRQPCVSTTSMKKIVYLFPRLPVFPLWLSLHPPLRCRCAVSGVIRVRSNSPPRTPARHFLALRAGPCCERWPSQLQGAQGHLLLNERLERGLAWPRERSRKAERAPTARTHSTFFCTNHGVATARTYNAFFAQSSMVDCQPSEFSVHADSR